jgi:hypothetical protein
MTPEEYAQKLVDWVSTVTQLDTEKGELPNVDDWQCNAAKLFRAAVEEEREACAKLCCEAPWNCRCAARIRARGGK